MILIEKNTETNLIATDALMWLTRCVQLYPFLFSPVFRLQSIQFDCYINASLSLIVFITQTATPMYKFQRFAYDFAIFRANYRRC